MSHVRRTDPPLAALLDSFSDLHRNRDATRPVDQVMGESTRSVTGRTKLPPSRLNGEHAMSSEVTKSSYGDLGAILDPSHPSVKRVVKAMEQTTDESSPDEME